MPYTKETYNPPGYNADLFHNKKTLATGVYTQIKGIIVDSTDKGKAFIIGNFYSTSIFSCTANGIVQFSAYTNSFSPYPSTFSSGSDIRCMLQASNGKHYFGGYLYTGGPTIYFARKDPSSIFIDYTVAVNSAVNDIKEIGSDISFTGDFGSYNLSTCPPVLTINTATNGLAFGFGSYASTGSSRMAYVNGEWFLTNQNIQGFIMSSTGGSWMEAYGGFNNYCSDLIMFNGQLYVSGSMTRNSSGSQFRNYVNRFNGAGWASVGANNLPGPCWDMEVYNGRLYALGYNYLYCLDPGDNKWKSAVEPSLITFNNATMFKFLNGKVYVADYNEFCELSK